MRTRHITEGVDHCQHDQSKSQRDPNVRNHTTANIIDDNRAGACEDHCKRADKLRRALLHKRARILTRASFFLPFFV